MRVHVEVREILAFLRRNRRVAIGGALTCRNRIFVRFESFFLRRLRRFSRIVRFHERRIFLHAWRRSPKIDKSELGRLVFNRRFGREDAAECGQRESHDKMDAERRCNRPGNFSPLSFRFSHEIFVRVNVSF